MTVAWAPMGPQRTTLVGRAIHGIGLDCGLPRTGYLDALEWRTPEGALLRTEAFDPPLLLQRSDVIVERRVEPGEELWLIGRDLGRALPPRKPRMSATNPQESP